MYTCPFGIIRIWHGLVGYQVMLLVVWSLFEVALKTQQEYALSQVDTRLDLDFKCRQDIKRQKPTNHEERKPLPTHIGAKDLPTAQRNCRGSMLDVTVMDQA